MNQCELSACIRHALERYFRDLDGEKPSALYDMVIRCVERPLLESVLAQTGGNQTEAAKMLGISRGTLRRKLAEHHLT
ncbi:MAG: Fis family transcriptional regulator [Rhodocyclaceae bacterium]|nr:Fis family transcriptional regulator [Rhodocyclaceae bacterium]